MRFDLIADNVIFDGISLEHQISLHKRSLSARDPACGWGPRCQRLWVESSQRGSDLLSLKSAAIKKWDEHISTYSQGGQVSKLGRLIFTRASLFNSSCVPSCVRLFFLLVVTNTHINDNAKINNNANINAFTSISVYSFRSINKDGVLEVRAARTILAGKSIWIS